MAEYDFAVFIGRFQPFHNGHLNVVRKALEKAKRVLILVGSANAARSTRNPFNFEERQLMIRAAMSNANLADRVTAAPINDMTYDDAGWVEQVQHTVRFWTGGYVAPRIMLIGHERDQSSYYLKLFPQWAYEPIACEDGIEATTIRKTYFNVASVNALTPDGLIGKFVPKGVANVMRDFMGGNVLPQLIAEEHYLAGYRRKWGAGPFLTVDSVVVQSGHVLLVERGGDPGKGKLALPGGFLEPSEPLLDGALRELREETLIDVDVRPHLKASSAFDDPHRSQRGRLITHAFLFDLPPGDFPKVAGADDAAAARWVPLSEIRVDAMFEDHAFIIRKMLKNL